MRQPKTGPAPSGSDVLRIEYIPLEQVGFWDKNPKKHDIGAIWESMKRHGFKDPPKYEPKLNAGFGGIVEGNGRTEALTLGFKEGELPPRGVIVASEWGLEGDGWLVPILFGVDAESEKAAESYGVDHNNLTLLGGDFTGFDISKLWDEKGYAELVEGLAENDELPVSVDGEDIDDLIARLTSDGDLGDGQSTSAGPGSGGPSPNLVPEMDRYSEQYGVIVLCKDEEHQQKIYDELKSLGYKLRVVTT